MRNIIEGRGRKKSNREKIEFAWKGIRAIFILFFYLYLLPL